MTHKLFSVSAAVLAAAAFAATPAFAERDHRGGGGGGRAAQAESRGRVETHGGGGAQPRYQAQPRVQAAPAPRVAPSAVPRAVPRASVIAPRADVRPGRAEAVGPQAIPRVAPRAEHPVVVGPRGYAYSGPGYAYSRPGYGYARPGYGYARPAYGYYRPWYGYRGYAPFRPYYFRPSYRFGFGIFVGYPVAFYSYPYPVPVYGYGAPYGEVTVGPNAAYGGIALEITPPDGDVYVDGSYVGVVRDFDGSRQPLTLTPGVHHIQVNQDGFQPLAFDVTVQPGQVIPYQGALQAY